MIHGSCLCGAVKFEVDRVAGPFELWHCSRCRKASGSAFVAGLLDDDPGLRPDKHIFVECKSDWFSISDSLPQLTRDELIADRLRSRNRSSS